MASDPQMSDSTPDKKPGLLQVVASVVASLFGVQSDANRQRDFIKGDPKDYIGVYVALVVIFVISMVIVVNMVLASAGK
jgi:predicted ABC-type exoprotein transport system permease subunit